MGCFVKVWRQWQWQWQCIKSINESRSLIFKLIFFCSVFFFSKIFFILGLRAVCHWTWFLCYLFMSIFVLRLESKTPHRMFDNAYTGLIFHWHWFWFCFCFRLNTENYEFSMNRQSIWFASGFYRIFCEWFIDCWKSFFGQNFPIYHNTIDNDSSEEKSWKMRKKR